MGEERINVLPGGGRVEMDRRDARALMDAGDGTAALVYLYILTENGAFSPEAASAALHTSPQEVRRAMGVLAGLHLVEYAPAQTPAMTEEHPALPSYSAADVARQVQDPQFRGLLREVEQVLGYSLATENVMKLMGMYEKLALPPEVILTMVSHCAEESQRKRGPAKRLTMGYIEREAYEWYRMGIVTLEQAERYIQAKVQRRSEMGELQRLLGIRDRALVTSERKYLEAWLDMGFPPQSIAIAFDRTVMATGRLTWKYMDAILRKWQAKKLFTPEEIRQKDAPAQRREPAYAARPREPQPAAPSSAAGKSELDDLRRMIDKLG